ncbi:hypothetical protein BleG1_0217 [Shouchella lehensis G1]|uniref:Uncharacterized protein n=1 Tax=Shouchella lehensis G1 TaxID=1246626 RepID=A0A060LS21_9BACI|nr:hypothetical protein BleG1_0217 [Shouchella lehensis G1]
MESLFSSILIGLFLLSPILFLYLGMKKTAGINGLIFLLFLHYWTKVMTYIGIRPVLNVDTVLWIGLLYLLSGFAFMAICLLIKTCVAFTHYFFLLLGILSLLLSLLFLFKSDFYTFLGSLPIFFCPSLFS